MEPKIETPTKAEKDKRFVDQGDDTILDIRTRLVWLKRDTWQITGKWMNWVQSKEYADNLNKLKFAGACNWRLPTSNEAKTLFDRSLKNKDHWGQAAFIPSVFPNGFGFLCWTSDVRNKIQGVRFGLRKGNTMYDDIYRVSRGATRIMRDLDQEDE
ncbi:MAG: DUF1566 domain-containing protein [Nitrospinales bacterium]